MSKGTNQYESIVIMHPDASDELQKQLFKKNKEIIEAHGGSLFSLDTWGRRPLANHINKNRKGIYFHSTFSADNKAVAELERTMGINENVLRYMHTRLSDKVTLQAYMESFKSSLAEGVAREKEREIKLQQKRAARAAAAGMS